MVSKKLLTSALLSSLAIAATGFAAEEERIEATKVAPMVNVLPNFYSIMQVRHYTNVSLNDNATTGTNVVGQGRYTLGSSFMDGKMDANVTLGVTKSTKTNKVVQRRTYVWMSYSALSLDNFSITPYADIRLPSNGGGTNANLGMNFGTSKKFSTAIGSVKIGASAEASSRLSSRQSSSTVEGLTDADKTNAAFSLTGEESDQVDSAAAPILTRYNTSISVRDAGKVKGLTFKFASYVDRYFKANMAKAVIDGEERIAMTGYAGKNTAFNLYKISYAVGNGLSIANETYQNFDGVYESRVDGTDASSLGARWNNIVKVTKSL